MYDLECGKAEGTGFPPPRLGRDAHVPSLRNGGQSLMEGSGVRGSTEGGERGQASRSEEEERRRGGTEREEEAEGRVWLTGGASRGGDSGGGRSRGGVQEEEEKEG